MQFHLAVGILRRATDAAKRKKKEKKKKGKKAKNEREAGYHAGDNEILGFEGYRE